MLLYSGGFRGGFSDFHWTPFVPDSNIIIMSILVLDLRLSEWINNRHFFARRSTKNLSRVIIFGLKQISRVALFLKWVWFGMEWVRLTIFSLTFCAHFLTWSSLNRILYLPLLYSLIFYICLLTNIVAHSPWHEEDQGWVSWQHSFPCCVYSKWAKSFFSSVCSYLDRFIRETLN